MHIVFYISGQYVFVYISRKWSKHIHAEENLKLKKVYIKHFFLLKVLKW